MLSRFNSVLLLTVITLTILTLFPLEQDFIPSFSDGDVRELDPVSNDYWTKVGDESVVTKSKDDGSLGEEWMKREEIIREPGLSCLEKDLFIVYVYSKPENGVRRQLIRETWGNLSRYRNATDLSLKLFFVVGWRRERSRNADLEREADTMDDLLIPDFEDSYENLTLKGLKAVDWIRRRCYTDRLQFVFKTDDDVFLNFYAVLDRVAQILATSNVHFLCFLNKGKHPKRSGKWAISPELYPEPIYPTYCSGAGYGMTRSAFDLVVNSCFQVPRLPIEDFFFSSYCISRVYPDTTIHYKPFRGRKCMLNVNDSKGNFLAGDLEYIATKTVVHPLPQQYWPDVLAIIERRRLERHGTFGES